MSNPYDGSQLCAQIDPEVFFPRNNFTKQEDLRVAISICNSCPLLEPCREYADNQSGTYGVWGGKLYDGTGYKSSLVVNFRGKVA